MIEVKKTITRKYEIYKASGFGTWGDLKVSRSKLYGERGMNGMHKCFICEKKFSEPDHINICFVKSYKNVLVCDECARRVNDARERTVEK